MLWGVEAEDVDVDVDEDVDEAEGEWEGNGEVVVPGKEGEEATEREEAYVEEGEVDLAGVAAVKVAEERRSCQTETTLALLALGTMSTTLMCKTLDSPLRERAWYWDWSIFMKYCFGHFLIAPLVNIPLPEFSIL